MQLVYRLTLAVAAVATLLPAQVDEIPIPEPSSIVLVAIGGIAIGAKLLYDRRKK